MLEETAVKYYGYLLLELGTDLEAEVLDDELCEELGEDTGVREIVKYFERDSKEINARNVRRALRSVYVLNDTLKIYNMDIKAENFIAHRLVSFGSSWSELYAFLKCCEKVNPTMAIGKRLKDKTNLDDMIEEEEMLTQLRVLPQAKYQLRHRGLPSGED